MLSIQAALWASSLQQPPVDPGPCEASKRGAGVARSGGGGQAGVAMSAMIHEARCVDRALVQFEPAGGPMGAHAHVMVQAPTLTPIACAPRTAQTGAAEGQHSALCLLGHTRGCWPRAPQPSGCPASGCPSRAVNQPPPEATLGSRGGALHTHSRPAAGPASARPRKDHCSPVTAMVRWADLPVGLDVQQLLRPGGVRWCLVAPLQAH